MKTTPLNGQVRRWEGGCTNLSCNTSFRCRCGQWLCRNAMDGSVYSTRDTLASLVMVVLVCFKYLSYFNQEVSKERDRSEEGVGGREGRKVIRSS
jgi:hypothetical protein